MIKGKNVALLERIDEFLKSGKNVGEFEVQQIVNNDEDEDLGDFSDEESIEGKIRINLSDMDLLSYKHDIENDKNIIECLLFEMYKVTPELDEKLNLLKKVVCEKIDNPINPGNNKVLIFSAFADTVNYLYRHLSPFLKKKFHLESGKVIGSDGAHCTIKSPNDVDTVLTMFSPLSKGKMEIFGDTYGEIDILFGTDCISEGQNLQDCDFVLNYDIHWNPVRIIQRFGRIDRLGSQNKQIQLVNFWPNITLDEYINLKERVESRMVITDITATGDENLLKGESADLAYRREQLKRLLEGEIVDLEDTRSGIVITDLGLNDFRMDMVTYIQENGEPKNVAFGMHTVIQANKEKNLPEGVIFILRNRNTEINIDSINRLHPYYLVFISIDGEVIVNHLEVKTVLDILRMACKGNTDPINELCDRFNRETKDGYKMEKYSKLLENAIDSIIEVKNEKDIDSLFKSGGTTALKGSLNGLNDFELIAFVVAKE